MYVCACVHVLCAFACMQMCVPIYTEEFFQCPALPLLNYTLKTGLSPLTETRTRPAAIKLSCLFLPPPPLNTGAIRHAHSNTQLFKLGARNLSSGHACTANILTHGDLSPGPEVFRKWPCKDQCSLLWGLSLKMCVCLSAISFVNRHGKSRALPWSCLLHRFIMNHIS